MINTKGHKYYSGPRRNFWNFKKAKWEIHNQFSETTFCNQPFSDNLKQEWQFFKRTINDAARLFIPRGNIKRFRPFVRLQDASLNALFVKRDLLRQELAQEIKQQYITQKKESWKTMCSSIDARAPNLKQWRFTKFFSNDQPQVKDSNIVLDPVGQVPQDNRVAANILDKFYKSISNLTFDENDKLPR
ncbi:RNA-directed DNA polymerase from mobile element jockey [Trichonephila inaurata madagascariensis]|uniref:RNA-directed DNA polymerase from mobile element jockey n=1 Tax=Trichonephila inaurata madagascariensis TaxID=2747483 RepID=A0A8X7CLL6_9ARAC|nr:RNA-directed DNA polymerase from mobile element jockey [Trichonephila inaurata madagascariensis]